MCLVPSWDLEGNLLSSVGWCCPTCTELCKWAFYALGSKKPIKLIPDVAQQSAFFKFVLPTEKRPTLRCVGRGFNCFLSERSCLTRHLQETKVTHTLIEEREGCYLRFWGRGLFLNHNRSMPGLCLTLCSEITPPGVWGAKHLKLRCLGFKTANQAPSCPILLWALVIPFCKEQLDTRAH